MQIPRADPTCSRTWRLRMPPSQATGVRSTRHRRRFALSSRTVAGSLHSHRRTHGTRGPACLVANFTVSMLGPSALVLAPWGAWSFVKTLRADARAQAECRLEETRQSVRQRALFTRADSAKVVEAIERGTTTATSDAATSSTVHRGWREASGCTG